MNPRLVLTGLGAALIVPPLAWIAVAASAAPTDPTPPAPTLEASVEPIAGPSGSASPTLISSASGTSTPVGPPTAASLRPDPLAAPPTTPPAANTSSRAVTSPSPTATASAAVPPVTPTPSQASATPTAAGKPTKAAKPTTVPQRPTPPPNASTAAATAKATKAPTRIANGWAPPTLTPGSHPLTTPAVSSKAKVSVTVACQPTAGCSAAGGALTIEPGTDITVTWSAPATATHAAWSMTRSASN